MTGQAPASCRVAIACGGTGGHLFPGMAVAGKLVERGCAVTLLTSTKEIDRLACRDVTGVEVVALPAVGLVRGGAMAFVRGFARAYRQSRACFWTRAPQIALAMGGFTSAAPILAAKRLGARTFLHESNAIPGRANGWLSWVVNEAFVGFESARARLHTRDVVVTGTPVRPQFQPRDAGECRRVFGLDPERPVLLVMGGSQGAAAINRLARAALPLIRAAVHELQYLHLSGGEDLEALQAEYQSQGARATVLAFCDQMHLALGAATIAVSRAGASSLAELAAMQVPALLVPYPAATDNHQLWNARAYEKTGAAQTIKEKEATPDALLKVLVPLLREQTLQTPMRMALARWHRASAAEEIATAMLARAQRAEASNRQRPARAERPGSGGSAVGIALREVS
jgi:UDP-N-acetylglucosamine--N-acetylmuramyl-(pentapeptide) pyrophosphoryl-undecaprenol N-acetylglucosamine transferase